MENQASRTSSSVPWIPILSTVIVLLVCGFIVYQMSYAPSTANPAAATTNPAPEAPVDLKTAYEKSDYKVIAIATNPFGEEPTNNSEMLYIVTKRGVNDSGCGGMYSSGPCYFFLESDYYNGPVKRFVGEWKENFAGLQQGSSYIDVDTVEFVASGGDAGAGTVQTWHLNVRTGVFTKISEMKTEESY